LQSVANLRDIGSELGDFADTAAVISQLDVVVSVDTSVAHLAGALGKPVLILLPHAADFRWMRQRSDTPWYPTAKLLRQPAFGDWDSVIAGLAGELRGYGQGQA
jgi:ADP-heptose:LPS heptosyltransferase